MHEYSIISALVSQVEAQAAPYQAARVRKLHIRLGELAGVDRGLLATAFETFRAATICADAELAIIGVPARWRCGQCGHEFSTGAVLRCTACGVPARLDGGDEIILDRIEMEVPDV